MAHAAEIFDAVTRLVHLVNPSASNPDIFSGQPDVEVWKFGGEDDDPYGDTVQTLNYNPLEAAKFITNICATRETVFRLKMKSQLLEVAFVVSVLRT